MGNIINGQQLFNHHSLQMRKSNSHEIVIDSEQPLQSKATRTPGFDRQQRQQKQFVTFLESDLRELVNYHAHKGVEVLLHNYRELQLRLRQKKPYDQLLLSRIEVEYQGEYVASQRAHERCCAFVGLLQSGQISKQLAEVFVRERRGIVALQEHDRCQCCLRFRIVEALVKFHKLLGAPVCSGF